MSHVAPDGNTYKYYYETDRFAGTQYYNESDYKIWSNFKIARANFYLYTGSVYTLAMLNNNGDYVVSARTDTGRNDLRADGRSEFNSSSAPVEYLTGCYITCINGNTPSSYGVITSTLNNTYFQGFSTLESLRAYLINPDVFQIPSFSFSGSILPGQNPSLNQGSCSLSTPYTTSFNFEGRCRKLVSLKQLLEEKTGYIMIDDVINRVKPYLYDHQTYEMYWIGDTQTFALYMSPSESYFDTDAGQGGLFHYKAPTKLILYNVTSRNHVSSFSRELNFTSDGNSWNIFSYYRFGVAGGYGDYDY